MKNMPEQEIYTKLVIKKYIRLLFLTAFIMFVLNKLYIRPFVLENDYPHIFQIVVLSLPNFSEAIMGTILLTGILFELRQLLGYKLKYIKTSYVYFSALILASTYVISQEFKLHNIGGNNVYDPYDLVASCIGLALTYITILKFGFLDISEAEINE